VVINALEHFDILNSIHGLGPEMRCFAEIAALAHDIGVATEIKNHHKDESDHAFTPPSELPGRCGLLLSGRHSCTK
jgi:hypothetical protein